MHSESYIQTENEDVAQNSQIIHEAYDEAIEETQG